MSINTATEMEIISTSLVLPMHVNRHDLNEL